jgi:hypothetical protein
MGVDRGVSLDQRIEHANGESLAAYWARPATRGSTPALVLCPRPRRRRGAWRPGLAFPELADRVAAQVSWRVLTFQLSGGTGGSTATTRLYAVDRELRLAINTAVVADRGDRVWLLGTGVGGAGVEGGAADRPAGTGRPNRLAGARLPIWPEAECPRRQPRLITPLPLPTDGCVPFDQNPAPRDLLSL